MGNGIAKKAAPTWVAAPTGEDHQTPKQEVNEDSNRGPINQPSLQKPHNLLTVKEIDLNIKSNTAKHKTNRFECTHDRETDDGRHRQAELVLRRGDVFNVTILLDRPYDREIHATRLSFKYGELKGEDPLVTRGTLVEIKVNGSGNQSFSNSEWGASIEAQKGNSVTVKVHIPDSCIVGVWRLDVTSYSSGKDKDGKETMLGCPYEHSKRLTILFNPWCKGDACYMLKEEDLEEYVLNERGILYQGTLPSIHKKPWNFGQFEEDVLEAALHVLKSAFRPGETWGLADPVKVVRRVAMVIKSSLVLKGRWAPKKRGPDFYKGGTPPCNWMGSVAILKQYLRTRAPVKYGQCWVFSGVTTTVFRALGIPSRSVTNFQSGVDTEGNNTIDMFFDRHNRNITPKFRRDFVWNYHVWNDVWLARADLSDKAGMDGWQALETTGYPPHDDVDDVFHGDHPCGPCPLRALKLGYCNINYDAGFLFSCVNADEVHWLVDKDGNRSVMEIKENTVGRCISTKGPGGSRLDLTNDYKFEEGAREEREAVLLAHETARKRMPGVYDIPKYQKEIKIKLKLNYWVMIGSNLQIELTATNIGVEQKLVKKMYVSVMPKTYNGNLGENFFREKIKNTTIAPGEESSFKITLTAKDYLPHLLEMSYLLVEVFAVVGSSDTRPDTRVVKSRDFAFTMPSLDIEGPTTAEFGDTVEYRVGFTNPLDIPLTKCRLSGESPGFRDVDEIGIPDILANGTMNHALKFKVKRPGTHSVLFKLDTAELDVNGETDVHVDS